jgi:hypothetical protein
MIVRKEGIIAFGMWLTGHDKDTIDKLLEDYNNYEPRKTSVPAETHVSQAASQAVLPSDKALTVEDLKCCGNCYSFDIINNKGGVCDKDNNQMPCTKSAVCEDWKFDAEK